MARPSGHISFHLPLAPFPPPYPPVMHSTGGTGVRWQWPCRGGRGGYITHGLLQWTALPAEWLPRRWGRTGGGLEAWAWPCAFTSPAGCRGAPLRGLQGLTAALRPHAPAQGNGCPLAIHPPKDRGTQMSLTGGRECGRPPSRQPLTPPPQIWGGGAAPKSRGRPSSAPPRRAPLTPTQRAPEEGPCSAPVGALGSATRAPPFNTAHTCQYFAGRRDPVVDVVH